MTGRRTRPLLVAAAALALATGAAACGSSDDNTSSTSGGGGSSSGGGKGGTIALLLPETKTTRYEEQDKPNFEKRVAELCPKCNVIYPNADQDATKQQQQAEAAITKGAKVIVMSAVDVKSAGAIVNRAQQAQVKVIAYGRLIPDAPISYYVSIDPFKVGQQQAQVLMDTLDKQGKKNPKVIMINGAPTDSNSKPYKDGATQVLKQRGANIVKSFDTPDWSPDKAQTEMDQAITSLGKNGFNGVYAAKDGTAGGAIAAMKGAGIDPSKKPTTGQDAELAAIQRIVAGEQYMTVYKDITVHEAPDAAQLAVSVAKGEDVPGGLVNDKTDNGKKSVPSVILSPVAVTRDDIQNTIVKDDFWPANQICTAKYASACKSAGIH
jgi:D-xylose transport system substrate-binding protein